MYVGIDPGLHGAVACLADCGVSFFDTPIICVGNRDDYNIPAMRKILEPMQDCAVVIEKVHAMPKNGSIGNFRLGYGYGLWLALVVSFGISYTLVAPQTWKKAMMPDMPKEKDSSRLRAMQLFPLTVNGLRLKKHHGRADALLMAEFGRRTHQGR